MAEKNTVLLRSLAVLLLLGLLGSVYLTISRVVAVIQLVMAI